jgi:hypothetical protein
MDTEQNKVSSTFSARLARLKPDRKLRVVLVLRPNNGQVYASGEVRTQQGRQTAIEGNRNAASGAIKEIDRILARVEGRRLSDNPTALGTIAIESTPAGIAELSHSDYVKAILEDQPISRLS